MSDVALCTLFLWDPHFHKSIREHVVDFSYWGLEFFLIEMAMWILKENIMNRSAYEERDRETNAVTVFALLIFLNSTNVSQAEPLFLSFRQDWFGAHELSRWRGGNFLIKYTKDFALVENIVNGMEEYTRLYLIENINIHSWWYT